MRMIRASAITARGAGWSATWTGYGRADASRWNDRLCARLDDPRRSVLYRPELDRLPGEQQTPLLRRPNWLATGLAALRLRAAAKETRTGRLLQSRTRPRRLQSRHTECAFRVLLTEAADEEGPLRRCTAAVLLGLGPHR